MIKRLLLCMFFLVISLGYGQVKIVDPAQRTANIIMDVNGNLISLRPDTPPLEQIAGAPKAYYSYYWEFDDGSYSTEKEPKHVYKAKGEYNVKLWTTNHYDSGKTPATRPKKVTVNDLSQEYHDEASMESDLDLLNRMSQAGNSIFFITNINIKQITLNLPTSEPTMENEKLQMDLRVCKICHLLMTLIMLQRKTNYYPLEPGRSIPQKKTICHSH